MAEHLWLVRRGSKLNNVSVAVSRNSERNGVRECLFNNDDGDDDATIIQNLVDALNADTPVGPGVTPVYPDGYFDEVFDVVDLSGTSDNNLRSEFDFIAFGDVILSKTTAAA